MKRLALETVTALLHTSLGRIAIAAGIRLTQYRVFAPRTAMLMEFDLLRLRARSVTPPSPPRLESPKDKLHFGCGRRRVEGWLNVDVAGSELDVDLAAGALPWKDRQFVAIVAQQVIEHLELGSELLPLLTELRRISKPGAEIWLSCPDLGRVCAAYTEDRGQGLIDDRLTRPNSGLGMEGIPSQQMINNLFQQSGEHRNLLDFELASWALRRSGFGECEHMEESQFLERFPGFPPRRDDRYSLYIKAVAV